MTLTILMDPQWVGKKSEWNSKSKPSLEFNVVKNIISEAAERQRIA